MSVVFLHGWGLHGGIWSETLSALGREDASAPDLPGYGEQPRTTPYDAAHLAEAIADELPRDAVVVGWSMGGMAALALAARHPIKALVLVGTSPVFVNREDWPHGLAPEVLVGFADALATDYRATLLRFLSLQARGGDGAREVIARLRQTVLDRDPPALETLAAGLELLRTVDLRDAAAAVACPTLVMHGLNDTLCPARAGEWLAAHIPNARLAVRPGAAHAPFLSHPAWFAGQIEEFLDEVGA
jgi:pimeloyl-[acyl-carrier protein] methyl ester esterase